VAVDNFYEDNLTVDRRTPIRCESNTKTSGAGAGDKDHVDSLLHLMRLSFLMDIE